MDNTLIILRGVSGSGKTTFSDLIENICKISNIRCVIGSADDFFINKEGKYEFNKDKLHIAHKQCIEKIETALFFKVPIICVANTNTTIKEIKKYMELGTKYDYKIISIILENRHGNKNIHNVPENTLEKQESALLNSLKLK